MGKPFDHIASTPESVVNSSAVNQLQRKHVWNYVQGIFADLEGMEILELNGGTGSDAVLFSESGANIVATDVSEEMYKVALDKTIGLSMSHSISSHYLTVDELDHALFNRKFDLVFSNFGGLNAVDHSSLQQLFRKLPDILNYNGRFIALIMPTFCVSELFYYLENFQFKKIFRRQVQENQVFGLWYHSVRSIKKLIANDFEVMGLKPIGITLPPSNVNSQFKNHPAILRVLDAMEGRLNKYSCFSCMSDYYLLDIRKR